MRDRLTTLDSAAAHHCFTAWDRRNNVGLTDQMEIHLIELAKWKPPASLDGESAWLYFFKEARGWQDLPATLHSRPLEAAMTVLKQFLENEADWHRYQQSRRSSAGTARAGRDKRALEDVMAVTACFYWKST